jgi:hypothetical protein
MMPVAQACFQPTAWLPDLLDGRRSSPVEGNSPPYFVRNKIKKWKLVNPKFAYLTVILQKNNLCNYPENVKCPYPRAVRLLKSRHHRIVADSNFGPSAVRLAAAEHSIIVIFQT